MNSKKEIKSACESMMFMWGEPLDSKDVADMFSISNKEAHQCFLELQSEYANEERGIQVREVNGAFQFVTKAENSEYIKRLCTPIKVRRLSQAALEVLAIIAYKQPITKAEIDSIRGIKCDRVIEGLMKKDLVGERGRSNAIGKPMMYGTTDNFLRQFDIKKISDLPVIEDIENLISEHPDDASIQQIENDANGSEQLSLELMEEVSGED